MQIINGRNDKVSNTELLGMRDFDNNKPAGNPNEVINSFDSDFMAPLRVIQTRKQGFPKMFKAIASYFTVHQT